MDFSTAASELDAIANHAAHNPLMLAPDEELVRALVVAIAQQGTNTIDGEGPMPWQTMVEKIAQCIRIIEQPSHAALPSDTNDLPGSIRQRFGEVFNKWDERERITGPSTVVDFLGGLASATYTAGRRSQSDSVDRDQFEDLLFAAMFME